MNKISNLYPQYQYSQERRQNSVPVAIERRSGTDRRNENRINIDSKLTRDIYEVKGQIAKLDNLFNHQHTVLQSFGAKNNLTQDQFVRTTKIDSTEMIRQESKQKQNSDTSLKLGMLASVLAGMATVSFLGPIGAVIAAGSAFYIGSKLLKTTIESEFRDDNNTKNV